MRFVPLIAFFTAFAHGLLGQSVGPGTPEKIDSDFRVAGGRAISLLDKTLEKECTAVAAKLTAQNDAESAAQISAQVRLRLEGTEVTKPHWAVAKLFQQYERARAAALRPHQDAAIERLNDLLKGSAGKDLPTVVKIGQMKTSIESGNVKPPQEKLSPVRFMNKYKLAKNWGYYTSPDYGVRYGVVTLEEDGTCLIKAAAEATGRWEPTEDPKVLQITLKTKDDDAETTTLILVDESHATMMRVSGQRYLRAL